MKIFLAFKEMFEKAFLTFWLCPHWNQYCTLLNCAITVSPVFFIYKTLKPSSRQVKVNTMAGVWKPKGKHHKRRQNPSRQRDE
jgi:hypothetical protein